MTDAAPANPAAPAPAAGAAPAAAPAAGAAGPNGGAPSWHANFAPEIKSFLEAKKYDLSDPAKVVDVMARSYQSAEKFIGVPQDELLRIPKANADTNEVNTFWNRVGVPKEAKDYDFSQVKAGNGEDVDPALLDAMRASLHANRVPKDMAPNVLRDVVKYLDGIESEYNATSTAEVQRQEQALRQNWGTRYAYNMQVAKDALDRVGQAAGLTQQQTNEAWDALSKIAGVGAASAMEMLRVIGSRMGEDQFRGSVNAPGNQPGAMSQADARARIAALQADQGFRERLLAGNVEARREWTNLHQILTGVQTVAA